MKINDEFNPIDCDVNAEIADACLDPEFKQKWLEGEPERLVRRFLLKMRTSANLTQKDIAEKLSTTRSVISRMEKAKHSPSLRQLYKYVNACGARLELKAVFPHKKRTKSVSVPKS